MTTATALTAALPAAQQDDAPLAFLETRLAQSPAFARLLIFGLPVLGMIVSLTWGLPLFATLMSGCLLLGTVLTCRRAMAVFTGKALRLLVASRLVVVLVLGAVLCCASGSAWTGIVSTTLLWLVADRLPGGHSLLHLRQIARKEE